MDRFSTSPMGDSIRIAVIPAAGAGRRLGYLSGLLPKALLPVYDRPLLHHAVDQLQALGVDKIYVVANVFRNKIAEYIDLIKPELHASIEIVDQSGLDGSADAILSIEQH